MFRLAVAIMFAAILAVSTQAQTKQIEEEDLSKRCLNISSWKLFTSKESKEEFSILLPESPWTKITDYYGEKAAEGFYSARCGWNLYFQVLSVEMDKVSCLPAKSSKVKEKCLNDFAKTYEDQYLLDGLLDYGEAQLIFHQNLDLDGYQGKQYVLSIQQYQYLNGNRNKENIVSAQEKRGLVRVYQAKSHYYAVRVIGDDGSSPLVKNFFDSFTIGRKIVFKK